MTPTICYQTDENGVFLHLVEAYPFPLEERLNVPFRAVQIPAPQVAGGYRARWVSPLNPMEPNYDTEGEWVTEEIPQPTPSEVRAETA